MGPYILLPSNLPLEAPPCPKCLGQKQVILFDDQSMQVDGHQTYRLSMMFDKL